MHRLFGLLICCLPAFAQPPERDVFNAALQAHWKARSEGRFAEAAARREEARDLLNRIPAEAPNLASAVQSVAQLYQNAGMNAKARAVIGSALARIPDGSAWRATLLNQLAESWHQDHNLLKFVSYLEQAMAAQATAKAPRESGETFTVIRGNYAMGPSRFVPRQFLVSGKAAPDVYQLQRLAYAYQEIGRPEALAAALAKMKAAAQEDRMALASFYSSRGQLSDAEVLYREQIKTSADNPGAMVEAALPLSNVYAEQQRWNDAIAVMQQAIAGLEGAAMPDTRGQAMWLRQSLANYYVQAGKTAEADRVYQQLLADSAANQDGTQMALLSNYAHYLNGTGRGAQAEKLLADYLGAHPGLQPWENANLLSALATVAPDETRRQEYGRRLADANPPDPRFPNVISRLVNQAQKAAGQGDIEDALRLSFEALDASATAPDRDQIAWALPGVAVELANHNAPDKAEQVFQRLFETVEGWSSDTVQPSITVAAQYARFLMSQPPRRAEALNAIERYRSLLTGANGTGTGLEEDVLRMKIDLARNEGSSDEAIRAAQDLVTLQDGLSGGTSQPYLRALETLADVYEGRSDWATAVPIRRRAVALVDLCSAPNDFSRIQSRVSAAFTLARAEEFDEAERLGSEAVSIARTLNNAAAEQASGQLQQIRELRKTAVRK